MDIKIQILSIIFSFLYGIILSFLIKCNYKFLTSQKKFYKIISNIIFCLDCALLYLLIIKEINNGSLHIYLLILIILGYVVSYKKTFYVSNYVKKHLINRKKK